MDSPHTATIGDIAVPDGVIGGPFGSELGRKDYVEAGVPVIRGGNLGTGEHRFNCSEFVFVSAEKAAELRRNQAIPGDIVVTQRGTLGQVGIVPDVGYEHFVISQSQMRLRCDARKVVPAYVYYWLLLPETVRYIESNAVAVGVPHINLAFFRSLRLPVPSLERQRGIVAVLALLDDKIELNSRMNETLEEMARALFKSWFVDFDRTDGEMPAGWSIDTLARACTAAGGEVQTGPFGSQLHASDYIAEGIPVVMPTNIRDRRVVPAGIVKISAVDAERLARHRLLRGDLVYSRRGDVEKHAIVGREEEGWLCGTGCLRVRPSRVGQHSMSSHYLSLWLDQPEQRAWISARAIGATMPNLNTTILGEVPVLLPDSEALAAFDEFMEPLDARIRALRAESGTLAELRDLLLPKLISGELRIRDAERAVEALA